MSSTSISEPHPGQLEVLHERLTRRAAEEGLLDLAYRTVDSPLGSLLVVHTGAGLVRIAFDLEGHDAVLHGLAAIVSPRVLRDDRQTQDTARQLDEYFAGRRHRFELPLDLRLVDGFRRQAVGALATIGWGETVSYGVLAARAGRPAAVRAAATACARNPIPLVLPCHRVIRADGTPGRYRGGDAAKAALLALEATR